MKDNTRKHRAIHPDFQFYLDFKDKELIRLYNSLRAFLLEICPDATELLYHTHALTSVYAVSERLADAFCMIPLYTQHLNLGFNKGTLLPDPHGLLQGTGKLIRHIPVNHKADYDNASVIALVQAAIRLALDDADRKTTGDAQTISKIKR